MKTKPTKTRPTALNSRDYRAPDFVTVWVVEVPIYGDCVAVGSRSAGSLGAFIPHEQTHCGTFAR